MNRRNVSRTAIFGAAAVLMLALSGSPSWGAPAGGGCGAAFTWATIADIRALRPMMPAGLAESIDHNGNGALCYKTHTTNDQNSPHVGQLNLVDDNAVAR